MRSRAVRWRDRWHTWWGLSPAERRLTLVATGLLPVFALGLRALGLRRWHARVARHIPPAPPCRPDMAPERLAAAVDRAARLSPGSPTCLVRSLVLWYLLARRGQHAQIVVGVRRPGTGLEAHAWVEVDGRPVNDAADVRRRFETFEQAVVPGLRP